MARLLQLGFEFGDMYENPNFVNNGNISASSAASGNYCFELINISIGISTVYWIFAEASEVYFQCRLLWTRELSGHHYISLRDSSGSVIMQLYRNDVTDVFDMYIGATLIASGTRRLYNNTHYLVEGRLKVDNTVGVVEIRVDGITDISYTGDTQPGSTNPSRFCVLGDDTYIDDIAINDTSGSDDNSWVGGSRFILLRPNGNGNYSNFDGSDGNKTDNWELVNEIPPNNDTDYVYTVSNNVKDSYALTNPGLENVTVVKVWTELRAKDDSGGPGHVQTLYRIASTDYNSSDLSLPGGGSYGRVIGPELRTNPNTSAAWTASDLDDLEAGFESKA